MQRSYHKILLSCIILLLSVNSIVKCSTKSKKSESDIHKLMEHLRNPQRREQTLSLPIQVDQKGAKLGSHIDVKYPWETKGALD